MVRSMSVEDAVNAVLCGNVTRVVMSPRLARCFSMMFVRKWYKTGEKEEILNRWAVACVAGKFGCPSEWDGCVFEIDARIAGAAGQRRFVRQDCEVHEAEMPSKGL